jgi:hypothetical protein
MFSALAVLGERAPVCQLLLEVEIRSVHMDDLLVEILDSIPLQTVLAPTSPRGTLSKCKSIYIIPTRNLQNLTSYHQKNHVLSPLMLLSSY